MWWPDDRLRQRWESSKHYEYEGNAQPWVQLLLYSLVVATKATTVVECGTFRGATAAWLGLAVEANGGGTVWCIERTPNDLARAQDYLDGLALPRTTFRYMKMTTLDFLATHWPTGVDFVFLDDDKHAVPEKLAALGRAEPHVLVAVHDVDHNYDEHGPARYFAAHGVVVPAPILHEHGHVGLVRA